MPPFSFKQALAVPVGKERSLSSPAQASPAQ